MHTRDARDGAWLADALRYQARCHEADRDRITARFEQLTARQSAPAAPRPRPFGPKRVRLLGIPLGIAAVLASATVAVAVSVGIAVSGSPRVVVPVTVPTTSAAPTSPAPSPATPGSATSGTPPTTASSAKAAPTGAVGRLPSAAWVDAFSNQYWAQEDLSLTPANTLKSLRIVVTVSGGSTVASTGTWTTVVGAQLETTVTRIPGGLEYVVTLKPGRSLNPTPYVFGFQFNRPAGDHDSTLDAYSVTATASDGTSLAAAGDFGG